MISAFLKKGFEKDYHYKNQILVQINYSLIFDKKF